MFLLCQLYFFISLACTTIGEPGSQSENPDPTDHYPFHEILGNDENYFLYWKFNISHITFETHVRTKGYVLLGFSSSSKLNAADIVVGWVANGIPHLKDGHTRGHQVPVLDNSQDWFILHGEENQFGTVLKFVRKLDTADPKDARISNNTLWTLFAFGLRDPPDSDFFPHDIFSHMQHRSLVLLPKVSTVKITDLMNDSPGDPSAKIISGNYTFSQHPILRPTEAYPYKEELDRNGSYILFWKFNSTHITFEVHVRTHGYVGFGLSPNGNMYPADVVIGWVKSGRAYFKDRHTIAHAEPLIDSSQDWHLLYAAENNFGTVLKMIRRLDTCDPNDLRITDSTIRIIFSYHPDDPPSETGLPYHGNTRRGAHSLMLLSKTQETTLPSDVITMDLQNDNFHVPAEFTYYHCRIFDMKTLGSKHHLVRFGPVIQQGHESIVHHIVVYKCPNIETKYIGTTYECRRPPIPILYPCLTFSLAWAVGGENFDFPDDVGLPYGDPSDPSLYIMETHYNNPLKHDGYVDNSGLRLYLTPTVRKHDAGILTVGAHVTPYQIIPPYDPNFISSGFCTENCLNRGLQNKQSGVNVFAVLQHAHLLGRGIKTRLLRHGVEQEPLADDKHYDFDFQDIRRVTKNRTLQSGDAVVVECTYDSTKRTTPTYGGLATTDEMCLSFIFYYPRMPVETCLAQALYDNMAIQGATLISQSRHFNWTDSTVQMNFKQNLANSNYAAICESSSLAQKSSKETVMLPTSRYPYISIKADCDRY